VRILIADDDPHVRSALRLLLENEPHISIVGEAATGEMLVEQAVASCCDVVLLDWDLPGLPAGYLAGLRAVCPDCRVVALSGRPEHGREARLAGVHFASKGDTPECLLGLLGGLGIGQSNGKAHEYPEADAGGPEALEVVEQPVRQPGA
jgi:chemotaxis response regulator CheB